MTTIVPDRILVYEEVSKTNLLVGQSKSSIFPISRCCRLGAKVERHLGSFWWICECGGILEEHIKGVALAVNDFENGPEGRYMIENAVAKWIGVDYKDVGVVIR